MKLNLNKGEIMWYINIKTNGSVETVDEFETAKEARAMRIEYQMGDSTNLYYLSKKCTLDWKDRK